MSNYCKKNSLKINSAKTKVLIFSKGKVRRVPDFYYNGSKIEVVYNYLYLGLNFQYNNKFNIAQKHLYDKASKAMFSLIRKSRKLLLPIDLQIDLFDKIVAPIVLYGSEIWGYTSVHLCDKLQLRFYKLLMNARKGTPTSMILGEFGKFPLNLEVKIRTLCFWYRLVTTIKDNKLSNIVYTFLFNLYEKGLYISPYLKFVHSTLNNLGLSYMWTNQLHLSLSPEHLRQTIKQRLNDQYIQCWYTEINSKESFYNYRIYKIDFKQEKYISMLNEHYVKIFFQFRTLNHKLPIQTGRIHSILRNERICQRCNLNLIGDEYHYLFECPFFTLQRNSYIKKYFLIRPNAIKYNQLFNNENMKVLENLVIFLKAIMQAF